MKKINDFGEKIGGAKKDIWAFFHSLPAEEQNEMAKKDVLWKRPRYDSLASKGIPKDVLFWRNEMRKAVKAHPEAYAEDYVNFCTSFRDDVEKCETMEDIKNFYDTAIFNYMKQVDDRRWKYATKSTRLFLNGNAVLQYIKHQDKIEKDCAKSNFMQSLEEKESHKYNIIQVTNNNLESKSSGLSRFANRVVCSNCIHIFYDTMNYKELLTGSDALYIVMYDKSKLGIFKAKEAAEQAIETDKEKRIEKKASNRKDAFLPPHLSSIERTGSNYKFFRLSDGNVLLSRYGLRGGEFGNYTTSKDRLGSINMAYDAFEDLYKAIGISAKDISLGGNLAIAFGARGRGNAMAHYEPVKNVINMTKMRGAGSLAHEWAHAMDMYIGNHFGLHGFMSGSVNADGVPDSAKALVQSFVTKPDGTETDFYAASKSFDGNYKQAGNGYWASNHEMFARAFACYVKDKLGDKKSDYLVGHAECATDGVFKAYPVGEERIIINDNFDKFFEEMRKKNIFTKKPEPTVNDKIEQTEDNIIDVCLFEGQGGQMRFC